MLKTKLYRPPLTKEHVYRTKLIKRFEQNFYKPLSLVCATAGYGKSMLLSSWLENHNGKYVWISLTENDNDLKVVHHFSYPAITEAIYPIKANKGP